MTIKLINIAFTFNNEISVHQTITIHHSIIQSIKILSKKCIAIEIHLSVCSCIVKVGTALPRNAQRQ